MNDIADHWVKEPDDNAGRIAAKRQQAHKNSAWIDIARALEIADTDNPAGLWEALSSRKVQCRWQHPDRWWVSKPVPPRLWEVGAISGNQLIGPDGTSLENEHQVFRINERHWREYLSKPAAAASPASEAEPAASTPPAESHAALPAPAPSSPEPAPASTPRKRATKRATPETYAAHVAEHLESTREYPRETDDKTWAKENGYVQHHVTVLRRQYREGLPEPERTKFKDVRKGRAPNKEPAH